jgi:molybdate transport system substrate-binding protein
MAAELKPKIKHPARGIPPQPIAAPLFELVASGDAEIGLAMISEIVQAPGVELVGPLPAEIRELSLPRSSLSRPRRQMRPKLSLNS